MKDILTEVMRNTGVWVPEVRIGGHQSLLISRG